MVLRLGLHVYVQSRNSKFTQTTNITNEQKKQNTVALVITRPTAPRKMGPLNCHFMDPINLKAERKHTAAK